MHWQLSRLHVPACTPSRLALTATCALLQAAAAFPMWPEGLARPTKAHSDPSVLQTIAVDLQASALRLTYRNPVVEQRYQKWYAEQVARVSWGFTGSWGCKYACLPGTADDALPANVRGASARLLMHKPFQPSSVC